ncbi:MAG TPA: hypothetical protein VJL60_05195, partial [Gammaproteobacteria bacterium]|nr:hypothetical protein [Gammaproteobacteria bacterium]
MKIKHFLFILLLFSLTGWGPFTTSARAPLLSAPTLAANNWIDEQIKIINKKASNIDPAVLKLSLIAYLRARYQGLDNKQLLTI